MPTATPTNQETKHQEKTPPAPAQTLGQAANSGNTLQGHAAINAVAPDSEIATEAVDEPFDQHSETSQLAYQYYLERGGEHGGHEDDWYRAEREIKARRQPK